MMAASITIYKQDGTRQCDSEIKPRPIDVDAKSIADIGVRVEGNGRHEQLPIFVPARCGSATAWANVFVISTSGLTQEQLLKLSSLSFRIWQFEPTAPVSGSLVAGDEDPFPHLQLAARLLTQDTPPDRISDLVGYHIRVYKTGDMLTLDFRLDRANFEIDPTSLAMVRFWIG